MLLQADHLAQHRQRNEPVRLHLPRATSSFDKRKNKKGGKKSKPSQLLLWENVFEVFPQLVVLVEKSAPHFGVHEFLLEDNIVCLACAERQRVKVGSTHGVQGVLDGCRVVGDASPKEGVEPAADVQLRDRRQAVALQ